jgi:hypothetical protein
MPARTDHYPPQAAMKVYFLWRRTGRSGDVFGLSLFNNARFRLAPFDSLLPLFSMPVTIFDNAPSIEFSVLNFANSVCSRFLGGLKAGFVRVAGMDSGVSSQPFQ